MITGIAGFIGAHLGRRLLERGDEVVGLDNLNPYYDVSLKEARLRGLVGERSTLRFYRLDLADRKGVAQIFADERPEVVVNLAAQAGVRYSLENPHAYAESNLAGFVNVLEGCRNWGIRHLVFASSSSVYGANTKVPFSVHDNTDHPVSLYAATKKANELMAHSYSHLYGLPTTGLRFFTVYGPWGRPDMAYFKFTKAISEGRPIDVYNHGNMSRDFAYVDDIGNNNPVDLLRFIEVLEDCLGRKAIKNFLPLQPGDVLSTYADVDDLMRDVGFKPGTPIEVGLEHFVGWYRSYYGRNEDHGQAGL